MAKQAYTDKELVDKIKQNDSGAFRLLFDRYFQVLLTVAINLLRDVNSAKDIVQEVFFQLWKKRATINILSNVEGYLKRATVNRSLTYIKSKKKVTTLEYAHNEASKQVEGQQLLEAQDVNEVIQATLDQLPERCRTIFVMKRIEGMSLKEIAEKLDISPKTVENQITKALKVLKEAVKPFVAQDA